jgi:hypothetical protein
VLKQCCCSLLLCKAALLLSLYLTGCAPFDNQRLGKSSKGDDLPVEMLDGGLLLSRSGEPELGLTLINKLDRTLWINVSFQTPNGLTDCLLSKELSPQAEHVYVCPQPRVQTETPYRVQIMIYNNLQQTQLLDELETQFRF